MIKYRISAPHPCSQFLRISLSFSNSTDQRVKLQLPGWRAGRYQLADYAQFVKNFEVHDQNGKRVPFQKESKNIWTFSLRAYQDYTVSYEFHAARMDAGSCWVDEKQIYINFVNCCLEVLGLLPQAYQIHFSQKGYNQVVCTLPETAPREYQAENFQELADSTLLASQKLVHWTYQVGQVSFHIWIKGEIFFSKKELLSHFERFTERLILDFEEFPVEEYHFIFQLLPYSHYHGVEHKKGTVITYGPAAKLAQPKHLDDLLGVSCHELYHAWNVCQIRPKELFPYDFGSETYTEAGWMLEGITTYMGDLYLLKSGVYSLNTYISHLSKVFDRESLVQGIQSQSILESSFDLWLDGYQPGIPFKKTSIYTHGALIALSLDIFLLQHGSSMAEVMRLAWQKYGKKQRGYSANSFWNLIKAQTKDKDQLNDFYSDYIDGKANIIHYLQEKFPAFGLDLVEVEHEDFLRSHLGILRDDTDKIVKIHPNSPAYDDLMIGDQIAFEKTESSVHLKTSRINGNQYTFDYEWTKKRFFPRFEIRQNHKTELFTKWST
ncbi:M61 family metallopeptidase [Algoriphagus namhaensis]